jgi:hypothetical protein
MTLHRRNPRRELDALRAERDRLRAALTAIVALDDGDSPDLWHFEKEFAQARAALEGKT